MDLGALTKSAMEHKKNQSLNQSWTTCRPTAPLRQRSTNRNSRLQADDGLHKLMMIGMKTVNKGDGMDGWNQVTETSFGKSTSFCQRGIKTVMTCYY